MKLVDVKSVKETARIFLPDIFLQMAVDRALDATPAADAIPVNAEDRGAAEQCLKVVEKFLNANLDCNILYEKKMDGTIHMTLVDL